jgi:hypothetical protein
MLPSSGLMQKAYSRSYRRNMSIIIPWCLALLCWCNFVDPIQGLYPPNPTTTATTIKNNNGINQRFTNYWKEDEQQPQQEPELSEMSSSSLSMEDPITSWRQHQREQELGKEDESSIVDEKGQRKLILSPTNSNQISKASLSIWFFVLLLRSLSHYETAGLVSSRKTNILTSLILLPPALLLVGNILGFLLSITSTATTSYTSNKRKFKLLINMNQAMELFLTFYYFLRLTFLPNPYVTKEIYVGKLFSCALYLISSHMFTRVSWDAARQPQPQQQSMSSSDSFHYYNHDYTNSYYQEDEDDNDTTSLLPPPPPTTTTNMVD